MIPKFFDPVREERASHFLQMAQAQNVILVDNQTIDKEAFINVGIQAILDGSADHISDPDVRFQLLARFYLEHGHEYKSE